MPKPIESLLGRRYGRWFVMSAAARGSHANYGGYWTCRCDCGTERVCSSAALKAGRSKSCGCLSAELVRQRFTTHGRTAIGGRSKEWRAWKDAKARCHNPNHRWYPAYGAKGVIMCERWRDSAQAFLSDMGQCPDGCSLDRIDPTGNYEPGNVRWADARTQQLNRRQPPIMVTTVGGLTRTAEELARMHGISANALRRRLKLGETLEDAVAAIRRQRPNRRRPTLQ